MNRMLMTVGVLALLVMAQPTLADGHEASVYVVHGIPGQDVDPELEACLQAYLAKAPEDRLQSAQALSARLQRLEPPTPWTRERIERWWATHRQESTR